MYMSQDDDDDVTGSVALLLNNDLPRTYPVSRDPSLVNRDCEVESPCTEMQPVRVRIVMVTFNRREGRCGVGLP